MPLLGNLVCHVLITLSSGERSLFAVFYIYIYLSAFVLRHRLPGSDDASHCDVIVVPLKSFAPSPLYLTFGINCENMDFRIVCNAHRSTSDPERMSDRADGKTGWKRDHRRIGAGGGEGGWTANRMRTTSWQDVM